MDGTGGTCTEICRGQNEENTSKKASRKKDKRSKRGASGILQLSAKAGTGMIEQLLMMVVCGMVCCLLCYAAAVPLRLIIFCDVQVPYVRNTVRKLYRCQGSHAQQL